MGGFVEKIEESELVGNDNEAIERLVKSQNVIVSRYNVIREEILKFLQTEIEKGRNEIEALMNNRMGVKKVMKIIENI